MRADLTPGAYLSTNPYDDAVAGARLSWSQHQAQTEVCLGYSTGQKELRGSVRHWNGTGLGARTGYDLQAFHEMEARPGPMPLSHRGFYEGHTGWRATAYRRLGERALGLLSFADERIWPLPERGTLVPTARDRIHTLRVAYLCDERDDALNPRSGRRIEAGATQAFEFLGGTRSYLTLAAERAQYAPLGEGGAFAWRARAGATAGTLPEQRRLALPSSGVRGYATVAEDGRANDAGSLVAVGNAEARWPIPGWQGVSLGPVGTLNAVQLAFFADAGAAKSSGAAWILRGAVGVGVRAPMVVFGRLPVVLRLDAAQGLTARGRLCTYVLLTTPELF